jgi:hypothetical protein
LKVKLRQYSICEIERLTPQEVGAIDVMAMLDPVDDGPELAGDPWHPRFFKGNIAKKEAQGAKTA